MHERRRPAEAGSPCRQAAASCLGVKLLVSFARAHSRAPGLAALLLRRPPCLPHHHHTRVSFKKSNALRRGMSVELTCAPALMLIIVWLPPSEVWRMCGACVARCGGGVGRSGGGLARCVRCGKVCARCGGGVVEVWRRCGRGVVRISRSCTLSDADLIGT